MAEQSEFKRDVGLFMAVMIGIGAMMGPGIFALPSEVAGLQVRWGFWHISLWASLPFSLHLATANWVQPFQ